MKRGSAGALCSAPHLCDETQGSKGPSISMSLHFQPAGRGRGFINKVFMKPVVYYLAVKVTAESAVFLFLPEGSSFQI